MEIVEYRSEEFTVRSDISNASSGHAIVDFPLPKKCRLPIPEYEPPPDYSPENTVKLDNIDGQEVRQSLLHNQSMLSTQSTTQVPSRISDNRETPRLCIQAQNVSVEVYQSPISNSASLSPSSNRELLLNTNQVKKTEKKCNICSWSKKCLCVLVAILVTALVLIVTFIIILIFTVCLGGDTPACSKQ